MNKNVPVYFAFAVIVVLLGLYNCGYLKPEEPVIVKSDTITVYKIIRDTIPGKTVFIRSKKDTVWINNIANKPDTSYSGLLIQYEELGNNYFSTNVFTTNFSLDTLGSITIVSTVQENELVENILIDSLVIPSRTITNQKERPKTRKLFIGATIVSGIALPTSGIYGGLQYQDKKDRIFGISAGINRVPQIGISYYHPIKFK